MIVLLTNNEVYVLLIEFVLIDISHNLIQQQTSMSVNYYDNVFITVVRIIIHYQLIRMKVGQMLGQ